MKAQFTPLGAILIVAMVVSLIAISYVWSESMIQNQKAYVDYVYAKNKLSEIRSAIGFVAGGEERQELVDVDLERIWLEVNVGDSYSGTLSDFKIESNSLDLLVMSSDKILTSSWKDIDPDAEITPIGQLGADDGGLIIAKDEGDTDRVSLWYRDLYDGEEYYRITLKRSSPWNIESDRTTLTFTNTGQVKEDGAWVTEITVSVR